MTAKRPQMYTLFEVVVGKKGKVSYKRASDYAFQINTARRIFQGRLLLGGTELRAVRLRRAA